MKQGWEIKTIGDVSELINGGTPKTNVPAYWDGDIRWITPADLGKLTKIAVDDTTRKITRLGLEKSSAKLFPENSIILSTRAPIGHLAVNTVPMCTNQGCRGIIPNRHVNSFYIYYFLKNNIKLLNRLGTGATFKELSTKALAGVEIPIPPLSEQQRIVSILDKVFAAIDKAKANTEQNLKNAREVFDSYLQNVFKEGNNNWEYKRLGDVCDTGAGGTPLKNHKDYYEGGNIPWLRSGEVNKKEITESELFITEKGLKNSSAKIFSINTVLVAMYGATAGQVGILRFECCTNQAICGILPNRNFIPEFLYYKFYAGKDSLVSQAVGGAQPNISQIKIKSTLIPVIPIKEQQSIVNKLDALEVETQKLEAIYNRKLDYLEELKKSVLHKAFSGNLNLDVEDSLINPILNQSTIPVNQE